LSTESAQALQFDENLYDSPEFREEFDKNMSNRRWRLENLYRIVNEQGTELQYKMREAQKILYLGLWYYNIVLKTRQPGITTAVALLFLDDCLFNSNTHAILISYSKDEMKETFHEKIRFAYDHLPFFIRDANPATKDSETGLRFKNGSSIRVTTSGRGGTYQRVHISEYGRICAHDPKKAREIKTGTLNAIHPGQIVVIESTAEGREGEFFRLSQQAKALGDDPNRVLSKMDPKFFFFPCYRNELNKLDVKNFIMYDYQQKYFEEMEVQLKIKFTKEFKAWYIAKWNQQGDDMKQEHPMTPEEAFEAAIMGAYYRNEFIQARKDGRITKIPYQEGILVNTWWDLGYNDENVIWFTQDIGREIHVIDFYRNSGEGLGHYSDYLKEKPYRYGNQWAPWDIEQHEKSSGKTVRHAARDLGINFKVSPKLSIRSGIQQVRSILKICHFDQEKCESGIASLEAYRKEWNESLGCYRDRPLHDINSNPADAFRTMAVSHEFRTVFEDPVNIQERRQRQKEKADPGGWT